MFHVKYEQLWAGDEFLSRLEEKAKAEIRTRGYGSAARVDSDLSNPEWFLAINDIAYSYCPTNRYLYFRKIEGKRPVPTWESYKGRVLDELLPEIYRRTLDYSVKTSLRNLRIAEEVQRSLLETIDTYKTDLGSDSLLNPPSSDEVDEFFDGLQKLCTYEAAMAGALLDYRISNLYDINVETEFRMLFPFDFKLKISSPSLGISGSAEVDFLLRESILGEIKSSKWYEFYNVGLAGYALAYEADRKKDVNLGVVVCPLFRRDRNIPIYKNLANIKIIAEPWRRMFLSKRNRRIELIKKGEDPNKPDDSSDCVGCGFYKECWDN